MKSAHIGIRSSAIVTATAWLCALPAAFGGGSAPIPVKKLVIDADAIVIAKILDGTVAAETVSVNLRLQQVLKGGLKAGAVVPVSYRLRGDAARYTTGIEKDRGLFFLKNTNGKWSIAPVASGSILEFRGAFFVLPANSMPKAFKIGPQASIHERILAEVAGALERAGGRYRGGAVDFDWEYRSNPSPAMKALFAQFKKSTNPVLRAAGLRASELH